MFLQSYRSQRPVSGEESGNLLEKDCLDDVTLPDVEQRVSRRHFSLLMRVFAVVLLGTVLSVAWLRRECLFTEVLEESPHTALSEQPSFSLVKNQASSPTPTTSLLEVFQVYQPVLTPNGATDETIQNDGGEITTTIAQASSGSSCDVLLMEHVFAFSYGQPFVGNYTPPACKFNRVTMNFTVTSRGRQFDRLALMYFNDTEVWRTSTAEPTTNGIEWTYIKDMTEYLYFWNSPQKLIFDLGNLIDSTYTASFNTTLTATFFNSQDTVDPASLIIPISARQGATNAASVFTLPSDNATNTISFPRNVNRAVFSVSACGQATEEFWWGNVLQSDIDSFEPVDGVLYGYSPFREVQVFIDGKLAGVQWPFPVIFTGGVVPGLWRPIVGIDAFDLREHEIDITPWLPVLCDGQQHTFEIKVAGVLDDGKGSGTLTETVGASWYVTGKIFAWLDSNANSVTTGKAPILSLPDPTISTSHKLTKNATGANETLQYTIDVKREISISSVVTSQNGSHASKWSQSLSVTNYGLYTDYGAVQQNNQTTTGTDQSTGRVAYKSSYSYPLYANTSYVVQPSGNFTIDAVIIRGLELGVEGHPVFPTGLQPFASIPQSSSLVSGFSGSQLSTSQNGSAHYFASPSAGISSGFGSTSQMLTFGGIDANNAATDTELYYRSIEAVNATVVSDHEILLGREIANYGGAAGSKAQTEMGLVLPKQALGRGPGGVKQILIQGGN